MSKKIFVNLPVKDLKKTVEFFTQLNFKFDQKFTNENATCMIISENIYVMLLVEKFFKTFTLKEICDSKKSTEVINCMSCDSKAQVDELVHKAVSAGGKMLGSPKDHGFMYEHGFEDIDGHMWELIYMEPAPKA